MRARRSGPGSEVTTADRAGRLVTVPQDALEPVVTRSLGAHWALWLAVGLVLLILGVGYIRRKWRAQGRDALAGSPGAGRDEGGDAVGVVEIEHRQPGGVGWLIGRDGDDVVVACAQRLLRRRSLAPHLDLGDRRALEAFDEDDVGLARYAARSPKAGGASSCRVRRSSQACGRDDDGLDRAGARVPLAVGAAIGGRRSWCVCLTVATFSPRAVKHGMRRSTSVVLPEFFQPTMPMSGGASATRRSAGEQRTRLLEVGRRIDIEERIDAARRRCLDRAEVGDGAALRVGEAVHARTFCWSDSASASASATRHSPATG